MTQEAKASKNFFRLDGGLNTEINELNLPDGFTRDEANYEILIDGSRRRRKGLAAESGAGAALTPLTLTATNACRSFVWRNVGGDPTKNFVVQQIGKYLYFADEGETVSTGWNTTNRIDMSFYASEATPTTTNLDDKRVSFAQGRGHLFVSGPYVKPFFVTWDSATDSFPSEEIPLKIRDFATIEEGINVQTEPTGTITDAHQYNLRNRGWRQGDMDQYLADTSKHPMLAALWYAGYKRTYGASVSEVDGTRSWDSAKMDAEVWGSSSAPVGSLFLDPFDTTIGFGIGGATNVVNITTWSFVDNGLTWDVTLTTSAAHGLSPADEFTVSGQLSDYEFDLAPLEPEQGTYSFNGKQTAIAGTSGSTLVFTVAQPMGWDTNGAWIDQYRKLGQVEPLVLTRGIGAEHEESFKAISFHAGRVFYAGMQNSEFADWITFSQIADSSEKYGKCYQEADPTDETFNQLVSSDGGTIVIEGMSEVMNLVSMRNSLIVLSRDGVWEISGGQRGVFTATGYSVRKLSDNGCSSPTGFQKLDGSLIYTGPGGIFVVSPNQFTGLLEVNSLSENTIQTLWNQIDVEKQERVQLSYDDALRRVYMLYGADDTENLNDTMLVFDTRVGGFFKYTFTISTDSGILTGFPILNADDTSSNKKMKFLYQASSSSVQVADFDQSDFNDWTGNNGPLPFLVFGHDSMGEFQKRGQAPVFTIYSKRTETGYTDTGQGFDPVNESSTLLTAYWDWTDDTVTNKVTTPREVYRHVRHFTPSGPSDVDGYPVVVTRNKIRGRGRALQVRFDGATDKDSHILGYTTNYKITRKV